MLTIERLALVFVGPEDYPGVPEKVLVVVDLPLDAGLPLGVELPGVVVLEGIAAEVSWMEIFGNFSRV